MRGWVSLMNRLHLCQVYVTHFRLSKPVEVKVTLWLVVYHQSVHHGVKPDVAHKHRLFFLQMNPCGQSIYITSSPIRGWVSPMNMPSLLSSVHIAHIAYYWKFFLLSYIQVLCQPRLCNADHAYLTYLLLQQQLSHLNVHKLDHCQV
jgi:hypothetical protein